MTVSNFFSLQRHSSVPFLPTSQKAEFRCAVSPALGVWKHGYFWSFVFLFVFMFLLFFFSFLLSFWSFYCAHILGGHKGQIAAPTEVTLGPGWGLSSTHCGPADPRPPPCCAPCSDRPLSFDPSCAQFGSRQYLTGLYCAWCSPQQQKRSVFHREIHTQRGYPAVSCRLHLRLPVHSAHPSMRWCNL